MSRIAKFLHSTASIVTSIVAILTGIITLVTTLAPGESDSSRQGDQPPASEDAPSSQASQPGPSSDSAKPEDSPPIRGGLHNVVLQVPVRESQTGAVDLDSIPPGVGSPINGWDIEVDVAPCCEIDGGEGENTNLAPLPSSGPEPAQAECASKIDVNGVGFGELARGDRFCVQTDQGRIAYLRVISVPSGTGTVQLKLTVWELPE